MAHVVHIVNQLLGEPRLAALRDFRVTNQRDIIREGQAKPPDIGGKQTCNDNSRDSR